MKLLDKFFGVSVVLTTFNGKSKGFLSQAIESVLTQTYQNFELLIVDDGSSDDTFEFLRSEYLDPKIKIITQKNSGVSVARNVGIANASFELIAFLDDDDIWEPEKLSLQTQEFLCQANLSMNYCAIKRVDADGKFLNLQYHQAPSEMYQALLFSNIVDATSGVVVKKDVFEQVGGFDNISQGAEDYEMWLRIASKFKINSLSTPLVKYRVHISNDSKNIEKSVVAIEEMFDKVCQNDKNLDKNFFLCNAYKNLANKSFEIENYEKFREIIKKIEHISDIPKNLRIKYLLSFAPSLIRLLRVFR